MKLTIVWSNTVEAASVPVRSRYAQLCCPDHEGVDSRPLGGSTGAHVRTFGAPPLSVCLFTLEAVQTRHGDFCGAPFIPTAVL